MTAATPTPTPSPEAFANASSGVASSVDLVGPALLIVIILIAAMVSASAYQALLQTSTYAAKSLAYAVKGLLTTVIIAVITAPLYFFAQLDSNTQTQVFRWLGIAIAGYIGLVIMGWVGERIWERLASQHETVTGTHPSEFFDAALEEGDD